MLSKMKRCRGYHGQGLGGGCRRLADYRIAASSERVRQKLVWDACRSASVRQRGGSRAGMAVVVSERCWSRVRNSEQERVSRRMSQAASKVTAWR